MGRAASDAMFDAIGGAYPWFEHSAFVMADLDSLIGFRGARARAQKQLNLGHLPWFRGVKIGAGWVLTGNDVLGLRVVCELSTLNVPPDKWDEAVRLVQSQSERVTFSTEKGDDDIVGVVAYPTFDGEWEIVEIRRKKEGMDPIPVAFCSLDVDRVIKETGRRCEELRRARWADVDASTD